MRESECERERKRERERVGGEGKGWDDPLSCYDTSGTPTFVRKSFLNENTFITSSFPDYVQPPKSYFII